MAQTNLGDGHIAEAMNEDGVTLEELVQDSSLGNISERARAEHEAVMTELERKKRARTLAIPTDENKVKMRLREMGEPITLFGEKAMDRRERLRYVLSQLLAARGDDAEGMQIESESEEEDEEKEEEFYTPGTEKLLQARREMATFSLRRARARTKRQRREAELPLAKIAAVRREMFEPLKTYTNFGSQIGDDRPVSMVRFSPDSKLLATASWTGNAKVWDVPGCNCQLVLRGHTDRIGGLAWHPQATLSQSPEAANIVTGGGDGLVNLWSLKNDRPLRTLKGHDGRVCRVAFHPSGSYIASASFDGTWRLWDVESGKELLLQEGHSKEVYSVECQDDGALIASGGLDAIGRVWDVRTGSSAMVLDGHVKEILGIDFAPNGYQIATGSGDDTIRIWDMRALKNLYTIPAHRSSVSDIKFFRASNERPPRFGETGSGDGAPDGMDVDSGKDKSGCADKDRDDEDHAPVELRRSGLYLASGGYDGLVKVWSADDWQMLRALAGDAGKVMSVDISGDNTYLASGEYGRTFKLWGALW